jgi:hypothetical protein
MHPHGGLLRKLTFGGTHSIASSVATHQPLHSRQHTGPDGAGPSIEIIPLEGRSPLRPAGFRLPPE